MLIPQYEPAFDQAEVSHLTSYLATKPYLTEHTKTRELEKALAAITGIKYCHMVPNGTLALTLAGLALGITSNSEVIVPNYTMIATPNSVRMLGAKPIFVDVEPTTLSLSLSAVEKNITPRTRAIILVSANGRYPSYDVESMRSLAKSYGLKLIEDAAQALGSYYPDGSHIGSKGDIATLSFSPPKIITTGQGGAVLTNDIELSNRIARYKDFGRSESGNDVHHSLGYNFKFTDLQACIGLEQLQKLPQRIKQKKTIYQLYASELSNVKQITLLQNDIRFTTPWFIDCLAHNRDELKEYLASNGIGSRKMYPPINKQKCYLSSSFNSHPISNYIGLMGLWLPSSPHLSPNEIQFVCKKIKSFYN